MFYKKKGIPDEGELVLCIVKKILYHSIFVDLVEYEDTTAMIHISEIAPGRIRNIRDYVRVGKTLVCKVLKLYKGKKQLDLSLRRVPVNQKLKKIEEYKQEQKAEKILEFVAEKLKVNIAKMYEEVGYKIIDQYGALFPFFQDVVVEGDSLFKKLNINEKYYKPLVKVIQERIKAPEVIVEGIFELYCYDSDGIKNIKKIIKDMEKLAQKKEIDIKIIYVGAPNYRLMIKATDYKTAEKEMILIKDYVIKEFEKINGEAKFIKK